MGQVQVVADQIKSVESSAVISFFSVSNVGPSGDVPLRVPAVTAEAGAVTSPRDGPKPAVWKSARSLAEVSAVVLGVSTKCQEHQGGSGSVGLSSVRWLCAGSVVEVVRWNRRRAGRRRKRDAYKRHCREKGAEDQKPAAPPSELFGCCHRNVSPHKSSPEPWSSPGEGQK